MPAAGPHSVPIGVSRLTWNTGWESMRPVALYNWTTPGWSRV
jgi:hypothetical protein